MFSILMISPGVFGAHVGAHVGAHIDDRVGAL